MINLDFFTQTIFYNISPFTLCFALFMFIAGVRFAVSFEEKRPIILKAVGIGVVYQYLVLPICALLLTRLLHTSVEVSLAIFLLVSFPNNPFSILITWIAGGSSLFAAVMGLISVLFSVTMTPYIFYTLMHMNPKTEAIFAGHSYTQFIGLFWDNRLEFFLVVVISVGLGILARKACRDLVELTESKVRWVALLFVVVYIGVIIFQHTSYFFDYWHFFSWEVLFYNIGILLLSFGVARLFRFSKPLTIGFVLSSSKNLMSTIMMIILTWYAQFKVTLWLVAVQASVTQWLFLLLILSLYKIPKMTRYSWK